MGLWCHSDEPAGMQLPHLSNRRRRTTAYQRKQNKRGAKGANLEQRRSQDGLDEDEDIHEGDRRD